MFTLVWQHDLGSEIQRQDLSGPAVAILQQGIVRINTRRRGWTEVRDGANRVVCGWPAAAWSCASRSARSWPWRSTQASSPAGIDAATRSTARSPIRRTRRRWRPCASTAAIGEPARGSRRQWNAAR